MPTESGYSSQKAYGTPQYKTVHNVGSDKSATNVITKGLIERSEDTLVIEAVASGFLGDGLKKQPVIKITITDHGAKRAGEVLRVYSGELENLELDIVQVIDADNFLIFDVMETIPLLGDEVKIAYFRTPQFDIAGNIITSSGPLQFTQDGMTVEVTEDTTDPTLNKPLPAGMYILKDGVSYPIQDSATPSEVVAVPVKIMAVDGTNINITAGDINVQLTDQGPNADVTRIGDGLNQWGMSDLGEGLVKDIVSGGFLDSIDNKQDDIIALQTDSLTALQSLDTKDFSTETTLAALLAAFNAEDFATQTTLAALLAELQLKADLTETQPVSLAAVPLPAGASTSALQTTGNTALTNINATLQGQTANSYGISTDVAEPDPAANATQIQALKGINSNIRASVGALFNDQTQAVTDVTPVTFTPPAGAKHMVISNNASATAANRVRFVAGANTPSWSVPRGQILGVGSFTSLIPAGAFKVIAEDASAAAEVSVSWF